MLINKKILFPGQQENEQIFIITRQHWMVLVTKLLVWFLFIIILFLSDWAINRYAPTLKKDPYLDYVNLIKTIYLLFILLGFLITWVMYYLNMQIVTNERIVDITQKSLLHHTISELHLSRIEDVTAEVNGILENFFDYGNVYVQTAAETNRFEFDRVPNPTKINKILLDLYEALPEKQKQKNPFNK
ncbi:MAG: hypothetical protein A3B10_00080 [Candidatus Doudnabacteria bacterium RIFCSPLOWO2_01_FULL_44_21]|uniref:DUF304 domain-containing protein n=1 Tax=Candidatus Doudnabacteria bacterium RIFCSPLOWO2_01_FULL_44_21 TaxID=1817841 RepID=A0A1F5PXB0_9BACT|nr:MAG: hypothetical protein A3B95_03535 [Candidatus Doudnabacteria bacterium RIFCSPHIGHO2_02_FULL_43_13b]OGE94546.1 MAG: hypothetical protein A3B10_00080 [Candidatus Doudnabacteria bacterium RIFCSPLOWO2_01_FULL_44_21]